MLRSVNSHLESPVNSPEEGKDDGAVLHLDELHMMEERERRLDVEASGGICSHRAK